MNPTLYIIAGCNGAGKTTASFTILPEILGVKEFINADEIAKGLSPFQPEKVAIEAGRIMLNRIDELISKKHDFAFETTLSTRSYVGKIRQAKKLGYKIVLVFFWLESVELAKERVAIRVSEGGHNIPEETIVRRYHKGLHNFFHLYKEMVDEWLFINNTEGPPQLISQLKANGTVLVKNEKIWSDLTNYYFYDKN